MADAINFGFPSNVYLDALRIELTLTSDKAQRAAIEAEIGRFEKRTAVALPKETA